MTIPRNPNKPPKRELSPAEKTVALAGKIKRLLAKVPREHIGFASELIAAHIAEQGAAHAANAAKNPDLPEMPDPVRAAFDQAAAHAE